MRKILFRGKRKDNGEWVCGDFLQDKDLEQYMIEYFDYYTDEDGLQRDYIQCEVMADTIGQYTGLTDKNGAKIFEGDILKYTRKNWHEPLSSKNNQDMVCFCEIYFDEKTHCFRFYHYEEDTKKCIGSGLLTFDDSRAEENIIEVIGNLYDNPELLKEV